MTYVLATLGSRKVRTGLCVLGVAIGVATIVTLWSISEGYRRSLVEYFQESGAELVAFRRGVVVVEFSRVAEETIERLRAEPEIEHVARANFLAIQAPALKMPAMFLFGRYPEERLMRRYARLLEEGRLLSAVDEVMVGSLAAQALGWEVGQTAQFFNDPVEGILHFRIVGIYTGDIPWENAGAVVHGRVIQERLDAGGEHPLLFLYLRPGADPQRVREDLEARYETLSVTLGERFLDQFDQLQYVDQFLWIVSTVALLVGGLGVLNALMMSISERTREIGMLRALGWSRRRILGTVVAEGLVISFAGGVAGLGLGVLASEALLGWYPAGFLVASYTLPTFVRAFTSAIVVGALGALYPAWRASRLSPAEALRYE